jgi:hypothetical protein
MSKMIRIDGDRQRGSAIIEFLQVLGITPNQNRTRFDSDMFSGSVWS